MLFAAPHFTMNKLEEILSCPVCLVIPRDTPIYQCNNGHLICKHCYKKVENTTDACPVCKKALPRDRIRNITAEQVIDNNPGFNFACDFSVHGCEFKGRKNNLKQHELRCNFRNVPCPNFTLSHRKKCKGVIPLNELLNHLAQTKGGKLHASKLNTEEKKFIIWKDWDTDSVYDPDVYNIDGNYFILNTMIRDGLFYAWVQVAADIDISNNYKVVMRISKYNYGTTLTECGKVFPIEWTYASVLLKEGDGVMCFGKALARKFGKGACIRFTIAYVGPLRAL